LRGNQGRNREPAGQCRIQPESLEAAFTDGGQQFKQIETGGEGVS
jgi:hypothetical protein